MLKRKHKIVQKLWQACYLPNFMEVTSQPKSLIFTVAEKFKMNLSWG